MKAIRIVALIGVIVSVAALLTACASFTMNTLEALPPPLLLAVGAVMLVLSHHAWVIRGSGRLAMPFLVTLSIVSVVILRVYPEYMYGYNIHGIIHRSLFSAILLIATALPALCYSIFYMLGARPKDQDISRYPIFIFPTVLILVAYGMLVVQVFLKGAPNFDWAVITRPFLFQHWSEITWNGEWPQWIRRSIEQAGMVNHILGTFLLMGLTSAISLPIGVGVGVYISEYGKSWTGAVVRSAITVLRSISVIILAMSMFSLVLSSTGTVFSDLIRGIYTDIVGTRQVGRGTFLIASAFISLLVIPVIARATEEGIRSLPREIYEASVGIGAPAGYTLLHVQLPWAFPNILTGVLLGCAEAAGTVTVILFVAGTGEYGVGLLNNVTSLSYLIFNIKYGLVSFNKIMAPYQFTAAIILLLITMGLSAGALVLKHKVTRRFRGA